MGMYASTHLYESGFNQLKNNIKVITVNNTQNTNMSSAIATALAWSTACASTDFVVSANTSGYILTISSNADLISATTLETTGVADHICMGTTATLYYITTCTTKALGSGDTVTMPSWTIWIKQPTS
jgi:hypothetical protein